MSLCACFPKYHYVLLAQRAELGQRRPGTVSGLLSFGLSAVQYARLPFPPTPPYPSLAQLLCSKPLPPVLDTRVGGRIFREPNFLNPEWCQGSVSGRLGNRPMPRTEAQDTRGKAKEAQAEPAVLFGPSPVLGPP